MAAKTQPPPKQRAKKPVKPTPKNKTAKAARRVAIVKGLIEQRTPRNIAHAIGISRKTLYEELKAPETQQLIQRWLEPYHDDVEALIPLAITAVKDAIKPERTFRGHRLPNDNVDRLRSVKALGVILGWAQGKTNAEEDRPIRKFSGTMEELLVVYKALTADQPHPDS